MPPMGEALRQALDRALVGQPGALEAANQALNALEAANQALNAVHVPAVKGKGKVDAVRDAVKGKGKVDAGHEAANQALDELHVPAVKGKGKLTNGVPGKSKDANGVPFKAQPVGKGKGVPFKAHPGIYARAVVVNIELPFAKATAKYGKGNGARSWAAPSRARSATRSPPPSSPDAA